MERLTGNKALNILQNDIFDSIYSVIFYLEDVSLSVRKELIQILEQGLKSLVQLMTRSRVLEWAEQNYISSESVQLIDQDPNIRQAFAIKNALSAYVFLITWYLSDFCKLKDTKEANLTKNKRGKNAKKDRTSDEHRSELDQNAIQLATNNIL